MLMARFGLLPLLIVACVVVGAGGTHLVHSREREQSDVAVANSLHARARMLASVLIGHAGLAADEWEMQRLARIAAADREVVDLAVLAGKPLRVVAGSRREWNGLSVDRVGFDEWRQRLDEVGSEVGSIRSADWSRFDYFQPFTLRNLSIPGLNEAPALVMVRLDGRDHAASMFSSGYLHRLLLLSVPFAVLACVLALVAFQVLAPIGILREVIRRRADGDRSIRPSRMPNSDFAMLADSLVGLFEQVDEAEAHLRGIFDAASDGIITIDARGIIRAFNPGAEIMFGVNAQEAIGTNVSRFVPEPDRSRHDGYLADCVRSGRSRILGFAREVVAERSDGSTFHCSLLINATVVGDEPIFVGVLRDITDEIEVRKELDAARKSAEVAAAAKATFLANMSHEIRTPLTAILGYAEELAVGETKPRDVEQSLQIIRQNGQHLMAVVNDILDMSKIEAGAMRVERVECHPDAVVAQVVGMLLGRAKERGLSLELRTASAMPVAIQSDPTRLRQILLNLVGNAIKFTERGSVVVEVAADYERGRMSFAVQDTGIGMTEVEQQRLFQSFSQADAGTTRKYGGTGLGLHISKRLAAMLGGDIELSSRKGEGSRFTLIVETGPIQPSESCSIATSVRVPKPRTLAQKLQGRVLVAEDGRDNQLLIRRILGAAGLQVEVADNGQLAVDAVARAEASETPFDLVLMDMQMPVMDGLEATRRLRAEGFGRGIVALSANVFAEDVQRCREAGCDDFCSKPIDRQALFAAIGEQLRRHRPVEKV
ncbi:MAG: Autoinducer 2 sensor kinase/phosphatase LuxQ [Planctomycetota bacterium]